MNFRPYVLILLGGALSALLYFNSLYFAGTSILGQLAPLPLLLAGLGLGLPAALSAATMALSLIFALGGVSGGLNYLVTTGVPIVFLVRQALLVRIQGRKKFWYPEGRLAADMAGLVTLLVLIATFVLPVTEIQEQLQKATQHAANQFGNPEVEAVVQALMKLMGTYYFAGVGFSACLVLFLNLALAQGLLRRAKMLQRPIMRLSRLDLPWWPWVVLVALGLGAVVAQGVFAVACINGLLSLSFIFLLQGLSIIHHFREKRGFSNLFLWFFYGLVLVFSWLVIFITLLGVFEPWLSLHQRIEMSQE